MASLLGNYASFILGAMGSAVFLMLLEPALLVLKRRSALQEVKRTKRQEERRKREA